MKKLLCLFLATLLLIPVGTVALAVNAGATDALRVEESSNTTRAEASVETVDGATITGKAEVTFEFNNDGTATLIQNNVSVMTVNISADGTYLFTEVPAGDYNLFISIPGWTEYTVNDINVSENEDITILETTVIAGDVNHSGSIDLNDINLVLGAFGENVTDENINLDVDHDKNIGIGDISMILALGNYGEVSYSSSYLNNGYSEPY